MARNRIKVTREDATGFDKVVRPVRDRSDYTTLKPDALEAFEKKRRPSIQPQSAHETTTETDSRESENRTPLHQEAQKGEDMPLQEPVVQLAVDKPDAELGMKADSSAQPDMKTDAAETVDLRLPPRGRPKNVKSISLRLRVLKRHVEPLSKLEAAGVELGNVFRTAYHGMSDVHFEARYIPQVSEPSGPARLSHYIRPTVEIEVINAIESQVRGGKSASRASLLLGQVEPKWFSNLDNAIKEFSK